MQSFFIRLEIIFFFFFGEQELKAMKNVVHPSP